MSTRERNSILVQLADGELGRRQREAILAWAGTRTSSYSAFLRRTLLEGAGRADLDITGPDIIERAKAGGRAKAARDDLSLAARAQDVKTILEGARGAVGLTLQREGPAFVLSAQEDEFWRGEESDGIRTEIWADTVSPDLRAQADDATERRIRSRLGSPAKTMTSGTAVRWPNPSSIHQPWRTGVIARVEVQAGTHAPLCYVVTPDDAPGTEGFFTVSNGRSILEPA